MKNKLNSRLLAALLLLFISFVNAWGQAARDPECSFALSGDTIPSSAFFNYGTGSKMKNANRRMKLTVGQMVVGIAQGNNNNINFGYWAGFLVAPYPAMVRATQGELLDRIQISWAPNPLGPFANGGFKLYRDGVFLASVDKNTRNYNDFNVIAGRPYNYEVRGINAYGEGSPGKAIGFQVPNGVVTGWVRTTNNNAVPNALVTLMPMQGFSALFGTFDGAFANGDTSTAGHFLPLNNNGDWTVSFWVKSKQASGNPVIFEMPSTKPLIVRSLNGTGIGVTAGGISLSGNFSSNAIQWRHVTITYSATQYRLYLDGVLADLKTGTTILTSPKLLVGARSSQSGWEGRLDELRIYHRRLDELDIPEIMEGTASSLTPGLKYYWKMDEERGTKSFDIRQRTKLFFCGAIFSNDRPPVRTSGMTNEDGYYRIESASYGTGTTFLAQPMKNFYLHRALKFVREDEDYATLPDFSLSPKATIETWVNSAGPNGIQTVLSKKWSNNSFQLQLISNGADNNIVVNFNNQTHNFGLLGLGYRHLAFTIDSSSAGTGITAWKDGNVLGNVLMPAYSGNWSDPSQPWVVGARKSGTDFVDFFGGLVDEVAVYDTIMSAILIQQHAQNSRDPQEKRLQIYYAMDEGNGNRLNNAGSMLLNERGMAFGTDWTTMAPNQSTTPHEFTPKTRQVSLNPSVTSVDQVDFIDRSTIAVSGFVRYQNTDCFARNIEILVNGASFSPAIYTDTTGKFIIDLEPGATVNLQPKYEDHEFFPSSWDLVNVISPVAGIVFNDITTRSINGVVAGGDCKLPIIQTGGANSTVCIVKARSLDGCYEKIFQITDPDGDYSFPTLPPIEMTIAVVEHSDPTIKTAFQVQGGKQVDLTKRDTMVDFIYYAPPQVEIISGLEPFSPTCPTIVLDKGSSYSVVVRLTEFYLGEGCPLDTGSLRIINDVAGAVTDTTFSSTTFLYKFKAGIVNPSPPFLQNIQFVGKNVAGNESSLVKQVLVTGLRSKANTFTTQLPDIPTMVLRDPPGDGSYAFIEKDQKMCKTLTIETQGEIGGGGGLVIDLSPEVNKVAAPLGAGVWFASGGGAVITIEGQATFERISENSFEYCTSFNERISTSANDLIVGTADSITYYPPESAWVNGGDLFIGGGLNVEFGFADQVSFNDTICSGKVAVKLAVSPQNFATQFIYSDYHIRNNVIRYLQSIADSPDVSPEKQDTCKRSINLWNKILRDNKKQIQEAKFKKNISFDAGIEYEYSETSDTTTNSSTLNGFNTEGSVNIALGFQTPAGVGIDANAKIIYSASRNETNGTSNGNSVTTGYVLADDDPGDAFTVDIAMDPVYKTPVFRTVTGQSSCPWEPRTAHREGNSLEFRDGSGAIALDVPSNEAAVFKFTLGNESETNEAWTYALTAGPESNPDGAKIFLNGAPLDKPVFYAIPYGESIPITLTVERGPEAYTYDSLEIVLYSLCEDERANALGILPDLDTILYSAQYISARFIEPCSEVDINVPQQDWVVFPDPITSGSDDIMRITVSGYDKVQDQFDSIRVQYRRSDGDGAWINIVPPVDALVNSIQPGAEILKANLGPVFTQFFWDTQGLGDGPYEIRAVSLCSDDASDKPGYSHVIKGRIERQPPSLIGTPQPSDGVYHVGDEISFSFNKHVNCSKINPVDNVQLFDATTNLPIDIDITCFENKIILNPNFQNQFFENRILRAELHDIEDKIGNKLVYEQWEFYVDRNELAWLTDSIGMTKLEDETKTVVANIHNRGGYPTPFKIIGLPDWVHVVPNQGTLAANEIRPISFTVDSTLAIGLWSDSITLRTNTGQNPFFMGGDEWLPLGVRVVCRPPNWNINANLFENTMNMVAQLNINGNISTDVEDMVVAYIGDTLVGRARLQYIPQVNKYLAYLTIYGNPNFVLQPIRLEIWDASECLRYAVLEDYFTFQPDVVIGNPLTPQVLHTTSYVVRDVPLGFGWNWMSFNLAFPNPDLDSALVTLRRPQNDLMKGQNAFSIYLNGAGWLGSLNTLNNTTMYVYRADVPDTLRMVGNQLDPSSTPIPLTAGWNWIGYIPNYSLPINEALSSVPAQTGDLIKSQVSFAQYINPQFGWIGNLKFLQPPNGYQLKIATPGTLIYPPKSSNKSATKGPNELAAESRGSSEQAGMSLWTVNPSQFEHSMTLIGMVKASNINVTTATMELGAFVGADVRGSAQAIYIAPLDAYQFFLTSYANASGEQLKFKLFDSSTGTVQDINESMYFAPDLHQGSIEAPVPFTMGATATKEANTAQVFEIQPNPFNTETSLRFVVSHPQDVQVTITSAGGRKVASMRTAAHEGLNVMAWRGQSDNGERLAPGVYFVHLQTETSSVVKKVVLQ
jgi:hypothetical protein